MDSPVQNSDPHLLTHGGKLRTKGKINDPFYCTSERVTERWRERAVSESVLCLTLIGMVRLWFH